MYSLNIYTLTGEWTATIPGAEWSYDRTLSEASPWSARLPRISEMVTALTIPEQGHPGRYAELLRKGGRVRIKDNNGKTVLRGVITGRDLDSEVIMVEGYTDEILLERYRTPADYGAVVEGMFLADAVAHVLRSWHVLRCHDADDWTDRVVNSSNVDFATEPGVPILTKSGGVYVSSGYLTLQFQRSELSDGSEEPFPDTGSFSPPAPEWERLRWSADSGGEVWTTVQYSTTSATSGFTAEFDGGIPDEVGLIINAPSADNVWVRINLYSNDQETEDDEGNAVGTTPRVFAVEVIGRGGQLVYPADGFPYAETSDIPVRGINANHTRQLDVITQMCEQVGWEFEVYQPDAGKPWKIQIAEQLGVDRTNQFTLRAGKNMEINRISDDDDELCNILNAMGEGDGINRPQVRRVNSSSVSEYGPYERTEEFPITTRSELIIAAEEYLEEHADPKPSFECTAVFPYGEEPEYHVGDLVQVVDPKTGIIQTSRIETESRSMGSEGVTVTLNLGKLMINLSNYLRTRRFIRPPAPPKPAGLYARGTVEGLQVGFAKPPRDWTFTEIYVSDTEAGLTNFSNLKYSGRASRQVFADVVPGTRYYITARHSYDRGTFSEFAEVVSATAVPMIDSRSVSVIVAASDSTEKAKKGADFVCDGTTDYLTIQEAMGLVNSGGEVRLMAGNYYFTGQVFIPSGVNITGEGYNTVFVQQVNDFIMIQGANSNYKRNITIRNIKITDDFPSPGAMGGIIIDRCHNVLIEGVYFFENNTSCIQTYVDSVVIPSLMNNIIIRSCLFDKPRGFSATIGDVKKGEFTNNIIENYDGGIGLYVVGSEDYSISNNRIEGFGTWGLWIFQCTDVDIMNNKFIGVSAIAGIYMDGNCDRFTIASNVVRNATNAINVLGASNDDNLITNNDFFSGGDILNTGTNTSFGAGNRLNDGTWST